MIQFLKQVLRKVPLIDAFARTSGWQSFRHNLTLVFQERKSITFTRFLRVPGQFDALSGTVLDLLLADGRVKNLRIVVLGCANGAEVYSIASILRMRRPNLHFRIDGFDIDQEMIHQAERGCYTAEDVLSDDLVNPAFIESTFRVEKDLYQIREELAKYACFGIADILDQASIGKIGTADIVYAQNLLYHFKPRTARRAFSNICRLLKPRAALFIDGMDLGLRCKLTRAHGLTPLEYRIEEIHNEARRIRGSHWPWVYWGLEPFSASRKNWPRRYATVFMRDVGAS